MKKQLFIMALMVKRAAAGLRACCLPKIFLDPAIRFIACQMSKSILLEEFTSPDNKGIYIVSNLVNFMNNGQQL